MIFKRLLLTLVFKCLFIAWIPALAQTILSKRISIGTEKQELSEVLKIIGQRGNFMFSFNSNHISSDSLVSLHTENLTIEETLNRLFNNQFDYKESSNYIILRYAPNHLSLILQESSGNQDHYVITGRIINSLTGKPVPNASIYEKVLLQSAITNTNGFFTIKLKDISKTIALTVSKDTYKDLTTHFLPEVIIKAGRHRIASGDGSYVEGDLTEVERTRLGRMFVTSRQKIQSLNIGGFIANAPVQASLSPGLSTHGSLSGQVINKFSLNATGGYSAGVNGMEIGLLFNINKKDVQYFQFGGAFNIVGGNAKGVQIGGLFNNVLDSVSGLQLSTGYNRIRGSVKGFQLGGLLNTVKQDFSGVQIALLGNRVKGSFGGFQFGGLHNATSGHFDGIQLSAGYNQTRKIFKGIQAGPVNFAKELKGLQIGFVNIADTSSGISLGLINIIRTGYHKVTLNTNEVIDINGAIKTGNKKLYTMLLGGMNTGTNNKLYTLGFGLGKESRLSNNLLLNPEISSRYLYMGAWQDVNLLNRLDLNLSFRLNRWFAISGGPAFNYYYSEQKERVGDFSLISKKKFSPGWNFGLTLF